MSSKFTFSEENFFCPVCHDIFEDPVFLSCSHSFCRDCLEKWWVEKEMNECPVCKSIHSGVDPPCNLALKNLCDTIRQKKQRRAPKRQRTSSEDLCSLLHTKEPKVFCKDCQQIVCMGCVQQKKHPNHTFLPIKKAALDLKGEVQISLSSLQEQLGVFNTFKATCDATAAYNKTQTEMATSKIKQHFTKLRKFLQEEEQARVSAVIEEEQQKSQMMREKIEDLNTEISTLSRTIRAVEEELRAEHVSFLRNYKTTRERVQFTRQDPQRIPGAMLDVAKHLGNLTFRVWDAMKGIVSYHPVILNPNTAHPTQRVCIDMTSVSCLPARLLNTDDDAVLQRLYVKGSEGFDSGTHSWDVEVGRNGDWKVGVLVDKREDLFENAVWCLEFNDGHYNAVCTAPRHPVGAGTTDVWLMRKPRRIRVQLDWSRGELSFSDPNSNKHIHTFTYTFTDTLHPFVYNAGPLPLTLLPGKVSATGSGN